MIKIEKNIQVPHEYPRTSHKYPFSEMEIGDSFIIKSNHRLVAAAAVMYAKRNNMKFSVRKFEGGWRCWRVKTQHSEA